MKTIFYRLRHRLGPASLFVALCLAGSTLAYTLMAKDKPDRPSVNIPLAETPIPRQGLPTGSYASIVKKVAPGVVKIVTTIKLQNNSAPLFPGFNDPFWRRFFGNQFPPEQQMGPEIERGIGSGVIVTKDGYILTNNHVVDHAKTVKVTLPDGRQFTAKVIGRDPKTDIAVVKVDAHDLPVVPLADSSQVEVGDVVLAIGNPFGVGETVTQGIVSAKNRGNMGIEHYEDFIQTDAAINPGNSGGPLVDVEGRCIGINTAILSRDGGNQGVGFAIPSNLARTVMESLIRYGHVTRGYMGVSIQDVTPDLAQEFGLKEARGALVGEVMPDGPAHKAGFKSGDIVLEYNGRKVKNSRDLQLRVAETKPGTRVPVEILRNGEKKTLHIKIGELGGHQQLAQSGPENNNSGTLNGVTVTDLDQQARQQFHVPKDVQGALITEVDPNSPSAQAGLRPGDVIESINRHLVKNADDAVRLTKHPKSKRTLVRVWDNGGSHYVVVDESGDSD